MTIKEAKKTTYGSLKIVQEKVEGLGYTNEKCVKRGIVNGHDTIFMIYFTLDNISGKCYAVVCDCIDDKILSEKEQSCSAEQYKMLIAC